MLTIKFSCPICHNALEFDEAAMGSQVQCPACFNQIQVPVPGSFQNNGNKGSKDNPLLLNELPNPQRIFESGTQHAKTIFKDLGQISFREEVMPIDSSNIGLLMKDFVFWAVTLLGIIPLLIVTINAPNTQLTMFALFFAFVWGVIFKKFILNDTGSWKWAAASLFFTGIIGIQILLFLYRTILPDFYLNLADSPNAFVSLIGFIFQVGVWEELIKALPLLILLKWKKNIRPQYLITIGIFSGLGFAAFENLRYGEDAVASAFYLTRDYGGEGLEIGVQNAMVITMLRAVSLVFCHAVFSGIVAYFVAIALMRKERAGALIVVGLAVAATLHGLYDWLAGIQPTIAALIAGFSFALFYGYLSKLRAGERVAEQVVV